MINIKCGKCSKDFELNGNNYVRRSSKTKNLCPACMKEVVSEIAKKTLSKYHWKNLSDEDKMIISKKNTEGLLKHWSTKTDDEKISRISPMRKGWEKWYDNVDPNELSEARRSWWDKLSDDEKRVHAERMREYNNSLSVEEKLGRVNKMMEAVSNFSEDRKKEMYRKSHQWYYDLSMADKELYSKLRKDYWASLSDEMKELYSQKGKNYWENLSDDEKREYSNKRAEYWNNLSTDVKLLISQRVTDRWKSMSDEEKMSRVRKVLSAKSGKNLLEEKFYSYFSKSYLSNDYSLKYQCVMSSGNIIHSWDYGIYSNDTNELVMVVDLDGSYFHADHCDYNGIHSKEEYDERRYMSVPAGIKISIIYENEFKNSFEYMIKTLMLNYDEFIEDQFKICRSFEFPFPNYSTLDLVKSWNQLMRLNPESKYINLSTRNREGDRIISHFHKSIYHAKTGRLSPVEAWEDDDLLRKVIRNRVIYANALNPNKILQGFNVTKVGSKVSVFSGGRAKLLIDKYLFDTREIFDPFSGFSGRMLGALSLGKTYIGQDISKLHVKESNDILTFLYDEGFEISGEVYQADILQSYGTYESLFTCSPYGNKERWFRVKVDNRTCDDWIDECLSRFKCRKYLFVVDETVRYKNHIVDIITNKSHLGNNNEYVIMIGGQ